MKPRWIQIIALLLVLPCLLGINVLVKQLELEHRNLQLGGNVKVDDKTKPSYALLSQLGTFRGVAINALWYRAEMQKRDGEFFEANRIANMITELQPRFPQVWGFQAWNMAYNISVKTNTAAERFDWVMKGVRLLREEGVPNNPNAIRLYRDLGWIHFHKIGGTTDNFHRYYKAEIAKEWHTLLGAPVEMQTPEQVIASFKRMADITETYFFSPAIEALIGEVSVATVSAFRNDYPEVDPFIEELRALGLGLEPQTLRLIGELMMYRHYYPWSVIEALDDDIITESHRPLIELIQRLEAERASVARSTSPEAREAALAAQVLWPGYLAVLDFLRVQTIISEYRMDPRFMHELMVRFGPVDWRSPGAHSLYWYAMGVERAYDKRDRTKIDQINTDRGIIHSLQMLFREGNLSFDPLGGPLRQGSVNGEPNIHFIQAYEDALNAAKGRAEDTDWGVANDTTYEAGHENFLHDAITFAYLYDQDREFTMARELYDKVRTLYGKDEIQAGLWKDKYRLTLDDFVRVILVEDLSMRQKPIQIIESFLFNAFRLGLGQNRPETFQRFVQWASAEHRKAQESREGGNDPNAPEARRQLPDFNSMFSSAYLRVMSQPGYSILERSRIYLNTPNDFRVQMYDRFMPRLIQQADAAGFNPFVMFPPPPGLEEYRQAQQQQLQQERGAGQNNAGTAERQ